MGCLSVAIIQNTRIRSERTENSRGLGTFIGVLFAITSGVVSSSVSILALILTVCRPHRNRREAESQEHSREED